MNFMICGGAAAERRFTPNIQRDVVMQWDVVA